jgi:hypothetical protein
MSIYSYIVSFFKKNEQEPDKILIKFNNNDLIKQKLTLKPSVNKSIGRNIPRHISNIKLEVFQEKNILTEILNVKLKKTNIKPRQVTFLPRNPILLEILVRIPIVN